MGKSKETAPQGGKRKSAAAGPFGANVQTSDVLTVIHLLASHDIEVVRNAITTTHSYCDSNPQVLTMFCEHGIWCKLYKLLTIKDYPILDLVIELVSKILSLTTFPLFLLDEARDVFTLMTNTFINNDMLEVLMNSCLIMIKIIENFTEIQELVYNKLLVNRALLVIKTKPGEDLKVTTMLLIEKLLCTKEQTKELISLPNYQPAMLLCFIKDVTTPGLQQSAIRLLIKICGFKEDDVLGNMYNNGVVQVLFQLMLDEQYLSIYFDIIYICSLILDNYDNCLSFVDTEEFPIVLAYYKRCTPEFQLRYVQLLAVLAQFQEDEYRQKLHTYGFEMVIIYLLEWSNWEVQRELFCIMINLSTHTFGLDYMVNDSCVDAIIRMLGMVTQLDLVALAVDVLHCFMKKNIRMIGLFFKRGGVDKLQELLIGYFEQLDTLVYDKVIVPTPDYTGRKEILGLYLGKILAREINIELLARGTTGFTGADLENMVNQAALRAAIDGADCVSMKYLESARDKVLMGPERKSRIPDEEANQITAYHEGGHAIVAYFTKDSHPLHKVTIIPRGPSLGHTAYIPEKERYHITKSQLLAMMDTMMGGRAAEELIFGPDKITSGASSDLKQATSIAIHMVKDWGMSERVGLRTHAESKPYSGDLLGPSTSEMIDMEIKKILSESYDRAKHILKSHAKEHKALAEALIKYETLDADDIKAIMADKSPNIELKS